MKRPSPLHSPEATQPHSPLAIHQPIPLPPISRRAALQMLSALGLAPFLPGTLNASNHLADAPPTTPSPASGVAAPFTDELARFFKLPAEEQAKARLNDAAYAKLSLEDRKAVQAAAFELFRKASEGALTENFAKRKIVVGKYTMPFTFEKRGTKPEGGWPVLMALHGGGGAPKALNDSQWDHMKKRYPVDNCIYIAPRAPTDEWNGFYTDYVYPLFQTLIRCLILFEEANPDRICLIGYSHGGYGAFAMGPKMPDLFAAVHSSAAAPTDGQTAAENLHTLNFTYMVGEFDKAFGRLDRCRAFEKKIAELKEKQPDLYPATFSYQPGRQHGNLPDFKVPQAMLKLKREPLPRRLTWKLTDRVIRHHYWLSVPAASSGQKLQVSLKENRIELTAEKAETIILNLDERLIDPVKPLELIVNGSPLPIRPGPAPAPEPAAPDAPAPVAPAAAALTPPYAHSTSAPSLTTYCRLLADRADPTLAFDRTVTITLPKPPPPPEKPKDKPAAKTTDKTPDKAPKKSDEKPPAN